MATPRIQDFLRDSFENTVQRSNSGEFVRFMHGFYMQLVPLKRNGETHRGPYTQLRQHLQNGTSTLSTEVIALNLIQAGLVDHAKNFLAHYKQKDIAEKIFADPRTVIIIARDGRRVRPQETFESRYGIQPRQYTPLGGEASSEDYAPIDEGSD